MTHAQIKDLKVQVKGKRVEDISRQKIAVIAASAGKKASIAARKNGHVTTRFENGKLMRVGSDGKTMPMDISGK